MVPGLCFRKTATILAHNFKGKINPLLDSFTVQLHTVFGVNINVKPGKFTFLTILV